MARKGCGKMISARRRRLTIRLGRRITVEEIEEAVEEILDEAASPRHEYSCLRDC